MKLLAIAHTAKRAHQWARLSFPNTIPAAAGATPQAATLPGSPVLTCLSLSWLGWHFPQRCQAMSPCLSGMRGYPQAKLAGPHAGASEASVLQGSCRASRTGGSGKRDGLLSGCPHQGCCLVITPSPHARLRCRKFVLVTPFPTSLPSPCRLERLQPETCRRRRHAGTGHPCHSLPSWSRTPAAGPASKALIGRKA